MLSVKDNLKMGDPLNSLGQSTMRIKDDDASQQGA